jgi:integrase/recombinase XerC
LNGYTNANITRRSSRAAHPIYFTPSANQGSTLMISRSLVLLEKTDPQFAPEAVWEQMKRGWRLRQSAKNWKDSTVDGAVGFLDFFQRVAGWPWDWQPRMWDTFQGGRHADGIALSSRRTQQSIIESFTLYLADPDNGWTDHCQDLFGKRPRPLVTEENRMLHKEHVESKVNVRPATHVELQKLFDCIDNVASTDTSLQRAVLAYRDSMVVKVTYAFGTRRSETCELSTFDFSRNIHQPAFGVYGALTVRNGKAKPCGPPRRRTVYTTALMDWIVEELKRYLVDVRPLFAGSGDDEHLFLTWDGRPFGWCAAASMFPRWRDDAGIDGTLGLHSLRRSYATHHIEAGYEAGAIGANMGHECDESTGDYVYLDDDYRHHAFELAQNALGGQE